MARGRKKIAVEQDYDALIASSEEKIANLTEELKLEKTNLKQLRKDRESWEAEKKRLEEQKKLEEVTKLVIESGKSLDEIKEMLS